MKQLLSSYFRKIAVICLFLLGSQAARANHILGMDLSYAWVSGNTYQIKLVVYGDCGNSSFSTLPTASPEICIYNGSSSIGNMTLTLQAPTAGLFTAPVCARDSDSTTCTNLSYSIPGIKKFTFTGNYTVSGASHYWQFIFNGWLGSSYAGRSLAITNITFSGGVSIIALIDTLDNTYFNNGFNASPHMLTDPTPYYCIDYPDYYNPLPVPTAGDSVSFSLVDGKLGVYPTTGVCTPTGSLVSYTGTAWSGIGMTQPVTAQTPLVVDSGSYSFVPTSGEIFFTPNTSQRGLVVYNIENFRHDTLLGTSQREMVFLAQACSNTPPKGKIIADSGQGVRVDSIEYKICAGSGAFKLDLSPTETYTSNPIYVSAIDVPTGATVTILNDSTTSPTVIFRWTSTAITPGTYVFYITYSDNACPIAGSNTVPYYIVISPPPTVITGGLSMCVGGSTFLSDTITGGTWLSVSTAVATIGSTTGIVNGVTAGTSQITYAIGTGCRRTTTVAVNPLPNTITGTLSMCAGLGTLLSDASSGGTWTSASTAVATIGSTSGLVAGIIAGTSIITYRLPTSCFITTTVAVNPLPPAISGITSFCLGTTSNLTEGSGPGTWSSSNTAVGTVGLTTGIVGGVSAGTVAITYTLGTGCITSITLTVNPLPTAIFGTPYMCQSGGTTTLADATTGGSWATTDGTVATIGSSTGIVTGVLPGTTAVTYTLISTGCSTMSTVTVNPTPTPISGVTTICLGSTTTLSDITTGGTWTSSPTTTAVVGPFTGIVTGLGLGVATVTYTLPTTCSTTVAVTVYPNPAPITGPTIVCVGGFITEIDVTGGGGTWSSSNTGVAPIISSTGLITGLSAGTSIITFMMSTGCFSTTTVTVSASPTAIGGPTSVCNGSSATLTDGVGGGAWISSNTAIATIGSGTGIINGVSNGTSLITYTLGGSCKVTRVESVIASPAVITGSVTVCTSATITLGDATAGGTWISGSTGVATVGTSGIVSGVTSGTAVISYKIADGCFKTDTIRVNASPTGILGPGSVCLGSSVTLSDATLGGGWTSANTSVATIGSGTGILFGVSLGTSVISYMIGSCKTTTTVTVTPLPAAITGSLGVCAGATTTLGDASAGGTWISGNIVVATVGSTSGIVAGLTAGTVIITFELPTGCMTTATVTVTTAPSAISGLLAMCAGTTTTLGDLTSGGTWISGTTAVATIGSGSGTLNALTAGTTIITYTLGGSCNATATVTVFAAPAAPGGAHAVCVGTTTTLSDIATGGTWVSGNTAVGTIGLSSGIFGGMSLGTTIVTYTAPGGCKVYDTMAVSPTPTGIIGADPVCLGASYDFSDAVSGGLWISSNSAVVSIGSTSGILTGISLGTATITYSLGSGCTAYKTETVIASPAPITGGLSICQGQTTSLGETSTGGTWSSGNILTATVGTSGSVFGVNAGTSIISYTYVSGCMATATVVVSPTPSAITGTFGLCAGTSTTLGDAASGGVWSSTNTAVATIGTSGTLLGLTGGTTTISYTLGGSCAATHIATVYTAPAAIGGPSALCVGSTMTLSDAVGGGTWISSNTSVATIGISSGIVTGGSLGTTIITYTVTGGCSITTTISVSPTPTAITGSAPLCAGSTIALGDAVSGGGWVSTNTAVATVGSLSGIVTGESAGTSMITYSLGSGCTATIVVTVMTSPSIISGPSAMCVGSSVTLHDTVLGGSLWTSSNLSVASVFSTGVISGVDYGTINGVGAGTATITYRISDGCLAFKQLTVSALPAAISGTMNVCVGGTTDLSDLTAGGTWASATTGVATVGLTSGIVSGVAAGTSVITYMLPGGCYITGTVTVNPAPAAIGGALSICAGATTVLTDGITGGTWASSNILVATIGTTSGSLSGISQGSAQITYTLAAGCSTVSTVTVNPVPGAISGVLNVCVGSTTILGDLSSGGTWASGTTSAATIGVTSGIASGAAPGTSIITYTLAGGCSTTAILTVNPSPAAIGGTTSICVGATTFLTDLSPGGTWSSSLTAVATIGSTSGAAIGVFPGTSLISYTLPAGCMVTTVLTVKNSPSPIIGSSTMCVSTTSDYSDLITGGTWLSSNTSVATIGFTSGIATSLTIGSWICTYTLSSGCFVTESVTVEPTASAIVVPAHVCSGSCYFLTDAVSGGSWTSTNTSTATVGSSSGMICGVAAGTTSITYSLGVGCTAWATVTVSVPPAAILGTPVLCQGTTTTLSNATLPGTWSSGGTTVATVGPTTGIVAGVGGGTAMITYVIADGCVATIEVTVNPIANISGPAAICQYSSANMTDAVPGGTWGSSNLAVASIDVSLGIVTGLTPGTSTIIYTSPGGCTTTKIITVNAVPNPITGTNNVCIGQTTALGDLTLSGTWTSSSTGVATVGASSGVVSGITAGTSIISYRLVTGCMVNDTITVNPLPGPILGSNSFCAGDTITLTDAVLGGSWSSSGSVVSVSSLSGTVTGTIAGTGTLTYTLGSGCIVSKILTVKPTPSAITGLDHLCVGQTTGLSDASGGGTWSSTDALEASIGSGTGIVTGVSAGSLAVIQYITSNGCKASMPFTVISLPSIIGGALPICVGSSEILTDSTAGGTWLSSNPSVATIGASTGVASGLASGTVLISYELGTGCIAISTIIINPLSPINGPSSVCTGQTIVLSDTTVGGTWHSSSTGIATAVSGGDTLGVVMGVSTGSVIISYTLGTGCYATKIINVNAAPDAISGTPQVCVGLTTTLSDLSSGGTWISGGATIASVGTTTGVVTGLTSGTAAISYFAGGCAAIMTVTVNPVPAPIAGNRGICLGYTTSLTDATSGGTWSSSSSSIASVGAGTGVVLGEATGTSVISYIMGSGCFITDTVSVNPIPGPITGGTNFCIGYTGTLHDFVTGGIWSSSDMSVASIGSNTGIVTGLANGSSIVTYVLGTSGCMVTTTVNILLLPPPITGNLSVCVGATDTLADAAAGGTWISGGILIATVGAGTGVVTGVDPGTTIITYTLGAGCTVTNTITVNPPPDLIIPSSSQLCVTSTTSLSDLSSGGTWISMDTSIATVDSLTGIVTGVHAGSDVVEYRLDLTGCTSSITLSVSLMPTAFTGNRNICLGSTSALGESVGGGSWFSTVSTVASVGTSGVVFGVGLGTSTIIYAMPGAGCLAEAVVTVLPPPSAYTVTGGGSYCAGGNGVNIGLSSSDPGTNYILYRGSTATGTFPGTGFPINFGLETVGGTYQVEAVNTTTGCSRIMTGTATVTIIPTVIPAVNIASVSSFTVCAGATVTYTAVPTGGGSTPSYIWNVDGTNVGTGNNYTFIPATGDLVKVTMTSIAACASPDTAVHTITMTVTPKQHPYVSFDAVPGDTVCQGMAVLLTASPVYGGTSPTFEWLVNGTVVGAGPVLSYIPSNNDAVSCFMTSNFTCLVTDTVTSPPVIMTVETPIIPSVTISANPGTLVGIGKTVTLTANVVNGGTNPTYQWYLNAVPVPGATNQTFTKSNFDTTFEDSVSVVVTSSGICPMPTHNWVYIDVNGLGVNTPASISELSVLPNPNNGTFMIKGTIGTADMELTVEVTDLLGQVVYQTKIMATGGKVNERISLGNLVANGMYILNLHTETDNQVFHIIVEQ